MKINLAIERDEKSCGDCGFLKASWFNRIGKCLLFHEQLAAETRYGEVEYWKPCNDCNDMFNNNK